MSKYEYMIFKMDTELTKKYFMVSEEDPVLERAEGTDIQWYPGAAASSCVTSSSSSHTHTHTHTHTHAIREGNDHLMEIHENLSWNDVADSLRGMQNESVLMLVCVCDSIHNLAACVSYVLTRSLNSLCRDR